MSRRSSESRALLRTDSHGAQASIKDVINPTRSFSYILLLTVIIGGLQLSWSTEFSNGTPYLLSLGMSKTIMSLVWIAGPLSGAIGQPIVGVISDKSRWSYGRRRPLILAGAGLTIASLLLLAWSRDIVGLFCPSDMPELDVRFKTIPLAVILVYVLDFSISVIQASARAYIVDNVPTHQQQDANAWAAKMTGIGNIIGYVLGSLNLPRLFPWLGNTQLKALSAFASFGLAATVIPAILYIPERDPNKDPTIVSSTDERITLKSIWDLNVSAMRRLSPQTRLACDIEFFAWIGYFPMLFYSTTYVGDIYRKEFMASRPPGAPALTQPELDLLAEEGTRRGAAALVVYSITSLVANFVLPYLVSTSYYATHRIDDALAVDEDEVSDLGADAEAPIVTSPTWLTTLKKKFEANKTAVGRIWTWSHVLFTLCMISTFWIDTADGATVLVGVLGVCWAVAHWAPFTIISEEISRIKEKKARSQVLHSKDHHVYHHYEHEAGIVLGVHNVFIASPQVISSLMSSILFKVFANSDGGDSIGWVFRFGGIFSIVAGFLSLYIKDPRQLDLQDEIDGTEEADSDE